MSSRQNKKKGIGDIGKLLACVGEYKKPRFCPRCAWWVR